MQDVLEGQMLGRYRLQQHIGHGGMAEVYLAHDEHLHRDIAVKVVHYGRTDDLARFQHEAKLLAPLTHEHILPIYDFGQQGPWHYLVMPYISHGTLADRLRTRGALTMEEAGLFLEQIASALQYAHDQGILHRDLKPSNILLRDPAYAYLADFGIARWLTRESGLTETGSFVGTPEYMAPEVFEDEVNQSSDLYALGIVLYEMLTSRAPFTGSHPLAIVQQQRNTPPTPPSQLNPAISSEVGQVVLCALEKDPRRRFQSARAFANAYRHALQTPAPFIAPTARVTSGFYADSTIAMQPALSTSPGIRPLAQSMPRTLSPQMRRLLTVVVPGLCALLLVTAALVFAFGNRGSNQPSVSSAPTASAHTLTPTATSRPTPTCTINDSAGILDQDQVCQAASSLPYSLVVNTSGSAGNQNTSQPADAHTIVISIVLGQHHGHDQPQVQVTIVGGSSVPLTRAQYHAAQDAFNHAAQDGDYTAATIAAIQSLQGNNTQ